MTFNEYQALALRTAPQNVSKEHDYKHALMGLVTETAELVDALKKEHAYGRTLDLVNVREEIGDILWYVPLFCRATGSPFIGPGRVDDMAVIGEELTASDFLLSDAACICGIAAHRLLCLPTVVEGSEWMVQTVIEALATMARLSNSNLSDVATTNIAKLRARYPDKFTTEAALNRNLDAERAILEGRAP